MPRPSSRDIILDAAEMLYATRGIDQVSLREINEHLGLSPAALHYHFKTKGALLTAILERRLRPAQQREILYQRLEDGTTLLDSRSFAEALVEPLGTIFVQDGVPGEHYVQVVASIYADQSQRYLDSLPAVFLSGPERYRTLLQRLLPELEATRVELLYGFLVATLMQSLSRYRLMVTSLLRETPLAVSKPTYVAELTDFISAGLTRPDLA